MDRAELDRRLLAAQRDNLDFNLAYIPSSFNVPLPEPFDSHYMNELFKLGYTLAAKGYPWSKAPPAYSEPQTLPTNRRPGG